MDGQAAGFWRRFAASLIDGIVVGVTDVILGLVLGTTGRILGYAVAAVYFTYFHGSTGRTPGDAALGIRVIDIENGQTIGYSRAFGRYLISNISALVLLLGYLWMLWDPRKQTWHDKVVRSLPVYTGSNI